MIMRPRFRLIGVRCGALLGAVIAASLTVLLLGPGVSAAAPPISGAIDYQTTIQVGIQTQYGPMVAAEFAPFKVAAPGPGRGALNFIEIRSENNVSFTVTVYAHDDYSPSIAANEGKHLVEGKQVTYFMIAFAGPSVETDPPGNHTDASDMAQRFANYPGAPRDQAYMVVVERRDRPPSEVHFTEDRVGSPGGGFLAGDFAPAAASALAVSAMAAVRSARRAS